MLEFKVGDKVTPKKDTLIHWPDDLTEGKIYIVAPHGSCVKVVDDNGTCYWSRPWNRFDKVPNKKIGGKLI